MKKTKLTLACLAAMGLALSACGRKSEAEKNRDTLERKVENVEDAITNDGARENARETREQARQEVEDRKD